MSTSKGFASVWRGHAPGGRQHEGALWPDDRAAPDHRRTGYDAERGRSPVRRRVSENLCLRLKRPLDQAAIGENRSP